MWNINSRSRQESNPQTLESQDEFILMFSIKYKDRIHLKLVWKINIFWLILTGNFIKQNLS